jgi:phosphatidylserine decarboxylase
VRQVSGLVARRIVCQARPGEVLLPGDKFGMIKLGSRTELWLGAHEDLEILVRPGDRVRGGQTPLARRVPRVAS